MRAAGHSNAPIFGVKHWQIIGAMDTRSTDSGRVIGRSQPIALGLCLDAIARGLRQGRPQPVDRGSQ